MFMECFAKVLNHFFQLVGITSTQRLRDKDFNSVGQAAVRRGHTYLLSNVKRTSLRSSSEKESGFVPENGIDMVPSTVLCLHSLSIAVIKAISRKTIGKKARNEVTACEVFWTGGTAETKGP
jgi:hypothetical protein